METNREPPVDLGNEYVLRVQGHRLPWSNSECHVAECLYLDLIGKIIYWRPSLSNPLFTMSGTSIKHAMGPRVTRVTSCHSTHVSYNERSAAIMN